MKNLSEDCKKKCQIFTPKENVREMLDWVGYTRNLYGKKVLEPTFGKGNILCEIVKRYIEDCIGNKLSLQQIKKGLERDIYGVEYDEYFLESCKSKLNDLVEFYEIKNVKWNFISKDFLEMKYDIGFDYIVGNPPYISYRDLDAKTREFVRNNFEVCKEGKFDYCYAFIEKGINLLKSGGKLVYLIPGSIFKNVFSKKLREFIITDLTDIFDYGSRALFNEEASGKRRSILTTSAVFIVNKNSNLPNINYYDVCNNDKPIVIEKNELGQKWVFVNNDIRGTKRFGDYFKVANSVATLFNEAYVITETDELYSKDIGLVLRGAASPKNLEKHKKEKIIFPYYYERGVLKRFDVDFFEEEYSEVCKHLKKYENDLLKRKSDLNTSWFEYGRSQALKDLNQPKLLTSIVVTNKIKVYFLKKDVIPYSGIYIVPKSDYSLKYAKEILESEAFFEYIKGVGIHASGGSFRITSKDINNYYFE